MAWDYVKFLHPLPQFVQLVRANHIRPEAVLLPSEVHIRLESMARALCIDCIFAEDLGNGIAREL